MLRKLGDLTSQIESMLLADRAREEQRLLELTGGDNTPEALQKLLFDQGYEAFLRVLPPDITVKEFALASMNRDLKAEADFIRSRLAECPRCPAHGGLCDVNTNHPSSVGRIPVFKDGIIVQEECDRWLRYRRFRIMRGFGVPLVFREATFEDYKPRTEKQRYAHSVCKRYVGLDADVVAPPFDAQGQGIMLQGPPGVGKTRLACTMVRYLFFRRIIPRARVFYSQTLIDALHYDQDRAERDAFMRELVEIPLLVLDDLGACAIEAFERKMLTQLVTERSAEGRPWIVTTNESIDTLNERLGDRVVSRLIQDMNILEMDGNDFRLESRRPMSPSAA